MRFFNTLFWSKKEFSSKDQVELYTCGPTVYGPAHIGNFRTYIFNDLLKRVLKEAGFSVRHVMNITDIDDKTIARSKGDKNKFKELTRSNEEKFWQDIEALNILKPDLAPRATDYIDKIIEFISDLMKKGYAYRGEDASIYFSINKFEGYGKLSRLDRREIRIGARVSQDEYSKENPADFVLWKAWDRRDGEIFWQTGFGKGRPGWHIECSVMAGETLGETIDIHTGAVDLIFPHHENEIAQSEARSGKKFVRFWLHPEHLLVDNEKMSKSLGNIYTLGDLKERGFTAMDFRYFVLGAHYRSKLNFTWEGLIAARNARERIIKILAAFRANPSPPARAKTENQSKYLKGFLTAISDDLDSAGALAKLWELLRNSRLEPREKLKEISIMDRVLGLNLVEDSRRKIEAPWQIRELAEKREEARKEKNFTRADELRLKIERLGWAIEDRAGDYFLTKK